jgi:cell division protein FtsZ
MRNGGVAILGSAVAEGEDRAQRAIEDAVNSPLLNDSEIRGAKWILVNITSAEGDYEITMDEEDTIMSYLREQAGENTDVIKGIGFDETLGNRIGVTIIATGFEHKDPFKAAPKPKEEKKPEEKIVMELGIEGEEKKLYSQPSLPLKEEKDPTAPTLVELPNVAPSVIQPSAQFYNTNIVTPQQETSSTQAEQTVHFELKQSNAENHSETINQKANESTATNTSNGLLSKPSNIYAEQKSTEQPSTKPIDTPPSKPEVNEQPEFELKLVLKEELPETADEPAMSQPISNSVEDLAMQDDADEQKRRAQERIQKLRNLSFNMNAADANNEFDSVPAYIRRNMELFGNTLTSVENFYSKYSVKPDENDKGQISSINTFLDGKKPD